jgi:hypothetical protein
VIDGGHHAMGSVSGRTGLQPRHAPSVGRSE